MKKRADLIPKDKFDQSTIAELMKLKEEEIRPIVPELIEWLADFNWPVASEVSKALALFPDSVIGELKKQLVLDANDDILKYWILVGMIPLFEKEKQQLFLPELQRIVENPTKGEVLEFVLEEAQIRLKKLIK